MTNRQENELSTFKGLNTLFLDNMTTISTYPKLKPLCLLFGDNIAKIDLLGELQSVDHSSTEDMKSQDKEKLAGYLVDASGRITAFATFENHPELISQVKVVKSDLERLADTKLKNCAGEMLKIGRLYQAVGSDYKLTPAFMDGLESLMTRFDTDIPAPIAGIKSKSDVTKEMKKTFAEQKDVLKGIEVFMKVVAVDDPALAASFESLNDVIEFGTGKLAIKCMVRDAATGEGIARVNVEFALTEGTELTKSVKRTATNGGINIETATEGPYVVTAKKLGYGTVVKNVNVIKGELCSILILMVKDAE